MDDRVINRQDIVEYLQQGCKPKEQWRIGTEHEKFAFSWDNFSPIPYEGDKGLAAYFKLFVEKGWQPILEKENVIGVKNLDGASITLEPGGQIELSGAPVESLHESCQEIHQHFQETKEILSEFGMGLIGLGVHPELPKEKFPHMPKARYDIMRKYLANQGNHALDMMYKTCTIQANIDFSSEADMVKKMRVGIALQPIATALFANSPFYNGEIKDQYSFRSHIWKDTDPDRCGMIPFVFEENFGFDSHVDYVINVPTFFIIRDGEYIPATSGTFKQFLEGNHPDLKDYQPTLEDLKNHFTTIYTEVRLKQYMEMRGADIGSMEQLTALPAFWVGLMYDDQNLNSLYDMILDWSVDEILKLREDVPQTALHTEFRGEKLLVLARKLVELAKQGLVKRNLLNENQDNESIYLQSLERIVDEGRTQAEVILDYYQNRWKKNMKLLYEELAY